MECTDCKYRKQLAIKRCKHFELGGDKKKKVCIICTKGYRLGIINVRHAYSVTHPEVLPRTRKIPAVMWLPVWYSQIVKLVNDR